MARQHIIDKKTYQSIIQPIKETLSEYCGYMNTATMKQNDVDNLLNIGKSLIIIKEYMSEKDEENLYYSKLLVSDLFSCLYCIKHHLPVRFFYLSYRSSIEAFIRLNSSLKESRNLEDIFVDFKNKNAEILNAEILYTDFYSKLKSMYNTSSGYVHGSNALDFNLKESIESMNEENTPQIISETISEAMKLMNLIRKFYLIKDNNLEKIKQLYRFRLPALKHLLSNQEENKLLK